MRTKTLLIVAAALAAGLATSMAQTYSANVVGYVNVTTPAGAGDIFLSNPLLTGDDVLSNVVVGVAGGSSALIWNGAGFDTYVYSGATHHWKNGTVVGDNTPVPPGVGFFLTTPSSATVTFVGTVAANPGGGTATNSLTTAVTPVGSLIPYADCVTNTSTINLRVGGGSSIQQWDVVNQGFNTFVFSGATHNWKIGTVTTNPVVQVAEGFFIAPNANTNWIETLP